MHQLFEKLRDGGEDAFRALVSEKIEEDLQLDFKCKASPERDGMGDDDKRYLGEALSGFSNSAGGLLVFGVNCRLGPDGVDCVQGLVPFVGPEKIASDIRSMIGSLLQPGNDGVEVAAVPSTHHPGYGYVLVWIPRSERRPHQSRAKGHFRYFKRIGRDFHAMEHYDVDDAFSRKSVATLQIEYAIRTSMSSGIDNEFNVDVYVKNTSENVARCPYIVLERAHGCTIAMHGVTQPFKLERGLKHISFRGGIDDVVHPGTEKHAAIFLVRFQRRDSSVWVNQFAPSSNVVHLELLYGCENGRAMVCKLAIGRKLFGLDP